MVIRSRHRNRFENPAARVISTIEDRIRKKHRGWPGRIDRLGRALRQEQTTSRQLRVAAAGAAVGAALVYFLDSERGARRHADVRQQAEHAAENVADAAATPRDSANRGRGIVAVARHRLAGLRDRLRDEWSPPLRFVSSATGLGLLAFGGSRIRSPAGAGMALAGSALLLRSLANMPVRRLTGVGAGRRAVDLEKTIHIDAPVEKVFAFVEEFQNFPRFMTHVLDVSPVEDGRWRWSVTGPANVPVSWESRVTEAEPNRLLAWESVPGSTVASAGQVRFEPADDGTRVHVRLSYNPPAGAIGHAVATILGAHPKKQLQDDLMRLKALMEIGRVRSESETMARDEVARDTDRSLH